MISDHQAVSINVLNKQLHCLSCGSSKKNDFLDCAECPHEINCSPLSRKWNQNIIIEISSTSVMHFAHYLSNDNCLLVRSCQIDFCFLSHTEKNFSYWVFSLQSQEPKAITGLDRESAHPLQLHAVMRSSFPAAYPGAKGRFWLYFFLSVQSVS